MGDARGASDQCGQLPDNHLTLRQDLARLNGRAAEPFDLAEERRWPQSSKEAPSKWASRSGLGVGALSRNNARIESSSTIGFSKAKAEAKAAQRGTLTSCCPFTFKYRLNGGSLEHGLMVLPDSVKLGGVYPVAFEPRSKGK